MVNQQMHTGVCLAMYSTDRFHTASRSMLDDLDARTGDCSATRPVCLQALLPLLPLLIALLVNHAREGVLPPARHTVCESDEARKEDAGGFAVPEGGREEGERAAVVHGCLRHVEGERSNGGVHDCCFPERLVGVIIAYHRCSKLWGKQKGEGGGEHTDSKVVAQVRSCHTKSPHGCQDQDVSGEEERDSGIANERGQERRVGRLRG